MLLTNCQPVPAPTLRVGIVHVPQNAAEHLVVDAAPADDGHDPVVLERPPAEHGRRQPARAGPLRYGFLGSDSIEKILF